MNKKFVIINPEDVNHYICSKTIKNINDMQQKGVVKLYDKQRPLNMLRVQEIIQFQIMQIRDFGKPKLRGTIVFAKSDETNKNWVIIDGQHRLYALKSLVKDNIIESSLNVLIEFVKVNTDRELMNEFKEINMAVPVAINYLTPNDVVNQCANMLLAKYPNAFCSSKAIRPKINIDSFKDELINCETIGHFDTPHSLTIYIESLNLYYKNKGSSELCKIIARENKSERKIVENCFKKCCDGSYLFLGIFKRNAWVTDMNII